MALCYTVLTAGSVEAVCRFLYFAVGILIKNKMLYGEKTVVLYAKKEKKRRKIRPHLSS